MGQRKQRYCGICSGPLMFLGKLAILEHYRCRNCGMMFSSRAGYLNKEQKEAVSRNKNNEKW